MRREIVSVLTRHSFLAILPLFLLATLTFMPILVAPIHGDDLISPFVFYERYGADSKLYIEKMSFAFDGHFNFLGEITSVFWLDIWTGVLSRTNSIWAFIAAYRLLRFLCALLFFAVCTLLIRLRSNQPLTPRVLASAVISFSLVTVYRVNWSSDPTSNYPLTGYLSAALGGLFLYLLCNRFFNKNRFRVFLCVAFLALCITYYEMNLSLLLVLAFAFYKILSTRQFLTMIVLSTLLALFVYLWALSPEPYQGGQLNIDLLFFRALFLQLFSILPLSSLPLAIYFSRDLLIYSLIVLPTIVYILFLLFRRTTLTHSFARNAAVWRLRKVDVYLFIYFLGSCFIFALSKKYQLELQYPGQVYMSLSVGQMMFVVYFSSIVNSILSDLKLYTFLILGLLLSINVMVNSAMVKTLNERTSNSQALLESWDKSERDRCRALDNWHNYDWERSYLDAMESGIIYAYREVNGVKFCSLDKDGNESVYE